MTHCVEEVLNEVLNVLRLHFYYNIEAGWDLTHPPPPPNAAYMRQQIVSAITAPSHYLIQWIIINWTLEYSLQRNLNQNTQFFIHEHASENIVCDMAAILSRGRWVKYMEHHILCVEWNHQFPSFGPRNRLPIFWSVGWGVLSFTERPVS